MIRYLKGNLLESEAEALVNTVNTVGVMGKGLALQFKEKFPENYRLYREACQQGMFHVGEMFVTLSNDLMGKKIIINFPTKTTWREPSNYQYIENGLVALKKEIVSRGIKSIAIPPLGSRNGGLDWNRVRVMIESALSDLDCDILIYEPNEAIIENLKKERVKLTPARAMMLNVMCDMIEQGEFVSEFAAEKIVYFLQRLGAEKEFSLNFKHGYYGPYSGKVRYVLRYMNGSYLMGLEEMNQKPFEPIWILPETKEISTAYLNESQHSSYLDYVNKTKSFLDRYYSNYSLELLATIDYILIHDERLKTWLSQNEDDVIQMVLEDISSWSKRKKLLFGQEPYIRVMLNHLKEWYYQLR